MQSKPTKLSKLREWKALLKPRPGFFDSSSLTLLNPLLIKEGILIAYFVRKPSLALGAALFDKNTAKLLWRSSNPIWQTNEKVLPTKAEFKEKLIIWFRAKKARYQLAIPREQLFGTLSYARLEKLQSNPILKATPEHSWESQQVFNPAAIYLDKRVHLVYRAIGNEGISVFGYASSKDGLHVDERLANPIYKMAIDPGCQPRVCFMSGGSYGGCEDPRLTRIGNNLYMTYVAFDGINPPRVALTSIKAKDFLKKHWNWKKPVLITPPDVVDKNGVIFPGKVNGCYVIAHRIFPNILIDFVESLDFDGQTFLKGEHRIEPRPDSWDSRKIGAGPPPIKTRDGWLLIYHAVDEREPDRYKVGAMLLELKNPMNVLCRSVRPILEPTAEYEWQGFKPGVTYPCGAIVKAGTLYVYYGAADSTVCVAYANLKEFLGQLKSSEPAKLQPIKNV